MAHGLFHSVENQIHVERSVTERFDSLEREHNEAVLDELYVLIGALKILGLDEAHIAMKSRLLSLRHDSIKS